MVTACNNPVQEGMAVHTNSPRARSTRRINVELILSQHDCKCATCVRSGNCELQKLSHDLNIHYQPYDVQPERSRIDLSVPIVREASKCIKCGSCYEKCRFGAVIRG